jgi:hypothetical protein
MSSRTSQWHQDGRAAGMLDCTAKGNFRMREPERRGGGLPSHVLQRSQPDPLQNVARI